MDPDQDENLEDDREEIMEDDDYDGVLNTDQGALHQCPFCPNKSFRSEQSLQYHLGMAHLEPDGTLVSEEELQDEAYDEPSKEPSNAANLIEKVGDKFVCTQCPDRPEFDLRNHLWKHIYRRHQPEKRIKCDVCGKGFLDKYSFTEHMRRHLGDKPFQCHLCKSSFVARYILETHMVTHNNRGEIVYKTKYSCSWCHMCFPSRQPLNNHILSKHLTECVQNPSDPENPFRCVICDAFTGETANDLTTHLTEHVLAQNEAVMANAGHTCNVCGRKYKHKRHLNRHAKTHLGIKPFECDVCGKRFTEASDFGEHKLIHDPIKTVGCPYCDKFFQSNIRRNEHIRKKHSEVKPYHCPRCPEKFSDLRSEANHRMDVHGEKNLIHECWKCGKTYVNADRHRKHEAMCVEGQKPERRPRKTKKDAGVEETGKKTVPAGEGSIKTEGEHANNGENSEEVTRSVVKKRKSRKSTPRKAPVGSPDIDGTVPQLQEEQVNCIEESVAVTDQEEEPAPPPVRKRKSRKSTPRKTKLRSAQLLEKSAESVDEEIPMPTLVPKVEVKEEPVDENERTTADLTLRNQLDIRELIPKLESADEFEEDLNDISSSHSDEESRDADQEMPEEEEPGAKDAQTLVQCPRCSKAFLRQDSLKRHEMRVHSEDVLKDAPAVLKCPHCPKAFVKQSSLKRHDSKTHNKGRVPTCHLCEKTFRKTSHLVRHIKSHTREKPYVCRFCGKAFFENWQLTKHEPTHDPNYEPPPTNSHEPILCNICSNYFANPQSFKRHQANVHGLGSRTGRTAKEERAFLCCICSKGFTTQGSLDRHERSHAGIKNLKCTLCPKLFADKTVLKRHIRTHSGEKPYQCEQCLKCFTIKGNLQKHARIHTGEKPFGCEVCGRAFGDKSTLRTHRGIHTGEGTSRKKRLLEPPPVDPKIPFMLIEENQFLKNSSRLQPDIHEVESS